MVADVSTHTPSDHKPNNAIQLRRVLTALWEIRALWRRLAGEVDKISEGDCEVSYFLYQRWINATVTI